METKMWWQMVPARKAALIFAGIVGFFLVVSLAWKLFAPSAKDSFALLDQEEKIRDMEDRVAKLQRELDESSKRIASLQSGSDEPTRARRSQRNNVRREEPRLINQNATAEPRLYETVRSTSVFEEPSSSSRKLGTIPNGIRVRVVGSSGDWLEVHSKQGRPPGFIRKEDAVLSR